MVVKLLTAEVLIAATASFLLLVVPNVFAKVVGWPAATGFWPRVAGGLLAGLAIATGADLAGWTQPGAKAGLGLAGHIAINFSLGFVLISLMMVGERPLTRRGRFFGWVAAAFFIMLALVEIAHL